jgi:hypothetical protein
MAAHALTRQATEEGRAEMDSIIVSRHPAAIQFLRRERPELVDAPVVAQAGPEDVQGRRVFGNLPLALAAVASEVWVIEFMGDPPRGAEYSLAEMDAAGAHLARYVVRAGPEPAAGERVLVWDQQSVNGRWGLKVYAPNADAVDGDRYAAMGWAVGYRAERRGVVSGREIIFLSPDPAVTAVWGINLDPEPGLEDGVERVVGTGLQSGRDGAVYNCAPKAFIRKYDAFRRGYWTWRIDPAGTPHEARDLDVIEAREMAEAVAR